MGHTGNWLTKKRVWTVSLPVVVLNSPAVSDLALGGSNPAFGTARDVVGIVLWALGLAIETASDAQKARRHSYLFFRTSGGKPYVLVQLHYKLNNPPKHKPFTVREPSPLFESFISRACGGVSTINNKKSQGGLWKWSRHPPYFGECVLH